MSKSANQLQLLNQQTARQVVEVVAVEEALSLSALMRGYASLVRTTTTGTLVGPRPQHPRRHQTQSVA